MGERIQQRRPVERRHLDDRIPVRRPVIDQHIGCDAKHFGAATGQRSCGELVGEAHLAGQHVLDRPHQPAELRGFRKRPAERIGDDEIVERLAVAGGVDARVKDVRAAQADRAGDAVEQPRMIGGIDADQRRAAGLVDDAGDRQRQRARVCPRHLPRVLEQYVGRLGDPIGIAEAPRIGREIGVQPAEISGERGLLGGDPLAATGLLVAEPQHLLRTLVKVAQQLALPVIPDVGTDGADIHHGQDQQQPQPLRRSDGFDEIEDGLEVGEVALECRRRHQQVMAHQPADRLGLGFAQPEPRAKLHRDVGADLAVVAAATLGDVVEQHRDVEHAARHQLRDDAAGERMIGLEAAGLDPRDQPDGADGMLVDRIVMVHVVLHLRHDAAEIGHEAAEDARLAHPAQHAFRVVTAGQHGHEQRVGARIAADRVANQRGVAPGLAHGGRMDLEALAVGQREQLDQPHRIGAEELVARYADAATAQRETVQLARPAGELRQPRTTGEILLEMREE